MADEIIKNTVREQENYIITYTKIITDIPGFYKDLENYEVYNGRKTLAELKEIIVTRFKNFTDTAKALKAMDVLVTVDTSVAHLAGALGVKTYLLLPYATDWRWFSDTKKTLWYDSIEIFKQDDSISWENPINSIVEKLC